MIPIDNNYFGKVIRDASKSRLLHNFGAAPLTHQIGKFLYPMKSIRNLPAPRDFFHPTLHEVGPFVRTKKCKF
jgi:hypothetical protein